jgi:triphosphoribosyl-dephospho-CoA synthase
VKSPLSIGQAAMLACLWEATAPKPGNVHPHAAFNDVCYADYLASAIAIGPAMDNATTQNLGTTILESVAATRKMVGRNTNLGTILLLAPLASVPRTLSLQEGVADVLRATDQEDAAQLYEAIRTARPGGIGTAEKMDIYQTPPGDLCVAMREAADRDCVARQYAENFAPLFDRIVPNLRTAIEAGMTLADAIVHVHLQTLHAFPDSLIARKCGIAVAEEASRRAGEVLAAGPQPSAAYQQALQMLDRYLRDERHQRNPGTTADLLAAGLFTLLRDGIIEDAQAFHKRVHYADQPH